MLQKLSLSIVAPVLLMACQTKPSNPQPKPEAKSTAMQICKSRPDFCTMQYDPVCGYDSAGKQLRTYGNACSACGHLEVHSHTPGECNDTKSQ